MIGMRCAACAGNVEKALSKLTGVMSANVLLSENTVNVHYDETKCSQDELRDAVRKIGFDIVIESTGEDISEQQDKIYRRELSGMKRDLIIAWACTVVMMLIMFTSHHSAYVNYIMFFLTLPVYLWSGRLFHINALRQLRHGMTSMDTLVSLSTSIAFLYSFILLISDSLHGNHAMYHLYFDASAMIIAFVLLGKFMEKRSNYNTGSAIRSLIGLQPREALLVKGRQEILVPISMLQPEDLIRVRSGERIPVDGEIKEGISTIDESMINGEPLPREKSVGQPVFAGTVNEANPLLIRTRSVGQDTLLGGIIRTVRESQATKAPIQRLADKIASVFVPVVLVIALLTYIGWSLWGGDSGTSLGFVFAVSVLVIACPCALGLATPTALVVGIGKAAQNHILIKDALALERLVKTDVAVFDKTGTITSGTPEVTHVSYAGDSSEELLYKQLLYSAELRSTHPMAKAVLEYLKLDQLQTVDITDVRNIPGKGITFSYQEDHYAIGSPSFIKEYIKSEETMVLKSYASDKDRTSLGSIWMSQENKIIAIADVTDRLPSTSIEAIGKLKSMGIGTIMLTGDKHEAAQAIADRIGIESCVAEVMPDEKNKFIKEMQKQGKVVLMAGDGINDTEALNQADISVAMSEGSDIAMDVSMITIMHSDLRLIPEAIELSRRTYRIIKQNLFWAMIYNLIAIPIAAGVLYPINGFVMNPGIAGAAMALSSISVVTNSLRLKRYHFGS